MDTVKQAAGRTVGEHFDGDLRRALIDAAIAALDEVGADRLSLRDVARRVGVSHAAPAHHFGDKTGLLTAVATEGFELFTMHLMHALLASGDEPVDQLAALGRSYAEFAELHPGHFDVMFRPAVICADDPAYVTVSAAAFEALRAHIEQCQHAGWRTHADNAALSSAAWALAHGVAVLRSQGSLARHFGDASLDGVVAMTFALLGDAP